MRPDLERGEELVHLHLRTELQLVPAPQTAPDLQQVSVDLLERRGEALVQGIELLRVGDETLLHERSQRHGIPVVPAPIGSHLADAPLGAVPGGLSVLLDQCGNQAGRADLDPGRARGGRRATRRGSLAGRGGDGGQDERAAARP